MSFAYDPLALALSQEAISVGADKKLSPVNNIIYNENGVVIKSIPAIHFEQSASFILEWNGIKLVFSGDTLPNQWWIEHTKGADIAIFECFLPPDLAASKWGFSKEEALNAVTTIH